MGKYNFSAMKFEEIIKRLTSKRRAQYRKPAYKQMNKRWTQHINREQLWEDVQK